MKKTLLALALVGLATLGHATRCDVFSNGNYHNNNFTYSLPLDNQQVTDCTITFSSLSCSSPGSLSWNFGGNSFGSFSCQNVSGNTWTCTLNSDQLDYLNDCLSSGNYNFNVCCTGGWNFGDCQINYDCHPCKNSVPDRAGTAALLGAALLTLEFARRKLVLAGSR